MTKRKLRYSGLGLAALTIAAVAACSSDNTGGGGGGTGPVGGSHSGGSGNATATGGSTPVGTGGSTPVGTGGSATPAGGNGAGGGASTGFACTNTMPACALITDGTNLAPNATSTGNFTVSGAVEGGTFSYQPNALTLDSQTKTALNVKGNVKAYDGFGIYFNTCYDVKTLAYTGVSFSIKGNAGPTGKVNFRVQTNSNTAANDPVNMSAKKGTCIATDPNNAYPDCHAAGKDVAVTSTPTVITVNFADLTGGLPTAGVNGADVVGLEWALAWQTGGFGTGGTGAGGAAAGGATGTGGSSAGGSAGKGGATAAGGSAAGGSAPSDGSYNVDITIDDVKFIGGPATPATCATGTGGSGAGGGSATGGGPATAGSSSGGSSSGGTGGSSGGAGGKAGSGG